MDLKKVIDKKETVSVPAVNVYPFTFRVYKDEPLDLSRTKESVWIENDDGEIVQNGFEDVDLKIQKAAEGVSLIDVLKRDQLACENSIAPVSDVQFGDVSKVEHDLVLADKQARSALDSFNNLPAGFRAMFDNDYRKFAQSFSDDMVKKYIDSVYKVDEKKVDDNKEDKK
nr:MAG TPA: hypothetical protein [Microviridae sp.]